MTTVAVVIPCYNEEAAIGTVVRDFRRVLPEARICVYDNNSKDRTVAVAREAGAEVAQETAQGKGNVVRRMFADIDADVYVLVDGDATYEAAAAPAMIERLLAERLDMINGQRTGDATDAYRAGHKFGNALLTGMVRVLFGSPISDMLSGYRILSRRFVRSFPLLAEGFGIETEMTVHALRLKMPVAEMPTDYRERPPGSASKLRTFHDGFVILRTILNLLKNERPFLFFGAIAGLLALLAIAIMIPVLITYFQTGLVPRLPTAVAASALMIAAFLSLTCGLILDTVTAGRWEVKRLSYLSFDAPRRRRDEDRATATAMPANTSAAAPIAAGFTSGSGTPGGT